MIAIAINAWRIKVKNQIDWPVMLWKLYTRRFHNEKFDAPPLNCGQFRIRQHLCWERNSLAGGTIDLGQLKTEKMRAPIHTQEPSSSTQDAHEPYLAD